MKRLKGLSFKELIKETVIEVKCGCELMPTCGSYGATTLNTKSGRELVVWNSMGEVNLSEVITT